MYVLKFRSSFYSTRFSLLIDPFHAIGLFLHPLKTSENQRFSDVFRGYKKNSGMKWVNVKIKTQKIIKTNQIRLIWLPIDIQEDNCFSSNFIFQEKSMVGKNTMTNSWIEEILHQRRNMHLSLLTVTIKQRMNKKSNGSMKLFHVSLDKYKSLQG